MVVKMKKPLVSLRFRDHTDTRPILMGGCLEDVSSQAALDAP